MDSLFTLDELESFGITVADLEELDEVGLGLDGDSGIISQLRGCCVINSRC